MGEVSQEEIKAAMERYPGMPVTLAVTRYMLDKQMEDSPTEELRAGTGWGGIHLETVGMLVQKLANAMYEQGKKAITLSISAQDFPESWDHIWLEIKHVDSGSSKEIHRMGLAGWPCCCCGETIRGDDTQAHVILLPKLARWEYPTWGNVLDGTQGGATAVRCGECSRASSEPTYAVKKVGDQFERVPVSELEDAER